ncbi:hypothetical protein BJ912DRAFT_398407 [Pholiota molesta]|nr:hypothetical protein BJ912DRAFT_398407 [Pholiota molesta]
MPGTRMHRGRKGLNFSRRQGAAHEKVVCQITDECRFKTCRGRTFVSFPKLKIRVCHQAALLLASSLLPSFRALLLSLLLSPLSLISYCTISSSPTLICIGLHTFAGPFLLFLCYKYRRRVCQCLCRPLDLLPTA